MLEFNESEHPRDDDGKFTDSDFFAEENNSKGIFSPKSKNKSKAEFFGKEYTGVKGSAAVDKLLQEKQGYVKNAFSRKEIGGIDLVWGDDSGGLAHVIKRRDKFKSEQMGNISGVDMVKKIPEIIDKGEFSVDSDDRPRFEYAGFRVAVRPTYDGEKLNWIVSAMEIKNPKAN